MKPNNVRQTLMLTLYGGANIHTFRVLAKGSIKVKKSISDRGAIWKAIERFELKYKTRRHIIAKVLKITAPKEIRTLGLQQLNMVTSLPHVVGPKDNLTVVISPGQALIKCVR